MPLEEEISLDLSAALAQIDEMGATLTSTLAEAAAAGAAEIDSALSGVNASISTDITLDDSSLTAAVDQIDSTTPVITVDDSSVIAATASVQDLVTAEGEADTTISVETDTTGVDAATESVQGLGDASGKATGEASGLGAEIGGLGGVAAVAGGSLDGVGGAIGSIPFGPAVIGGAAFGAVLEKSIGLALNADEAQRRFNRTFGDSASEIEDLSGTVPGLTGKIGDLAVETGSSAAGLRDWAATFGASAQAAGFANDQVKETTQGMIVLANQIAATNPKLGTADEIITRLSGALSRGGRFAAIYGFGWLNAGLIADRGAELFHKAGTSLSFIEKQAAGLSLVMERMGPTMNKSIEEGTKDPIVKLRQLERELQKIVVEGTKPLLGGVVSGIERVAPAVEGVAKAFTGLTSGVLPVFGAEMSAMGAVLSRVASLLSNPVVQGLLTVGGAYLAATKSATLFAGILDKLLGKLGDVARFAGLDNIGTRFDGLSGGARQAEAAVTNLIAKQEAAAVASDAYTAALETEALTSEEAGATLAAYQLQMEAATIADEKSIVAKQAAAEEAAALEAARSGEAADLAALQAAQEAKVAADEEEAVALEQLTAATELYQQALADLLAEMGPAGVEMQALGDEALFAAGEVSAASEEIALGAETMGLFASAASAVLLPLGLGVGALTLWSQANAKSKQEVKDATENLTKYADSVEYTNTQLATLNVDEVRTKFEKSSSAVKDFTDRLHDRSVLDDFNRMKLSASEAGLAIDGDADAQRRFVAELIRGGDLRIDSSSALNPEQIQKIGEMWLKNGGELQKYKGIEATVHTGIVADIFRDQAEAARKARDGIVEKARAEVQDGKASEVSSIRALAASGNLGLLGEKGKKAAQALLEESDAAKASADASDAAAAAAKGAGGNYEDLIVSVQAAAAALGSGQKISAADILGAEKLKDLPNFKQFPKEVQDAANAVADYGSASADAARQVGSLVDQNGLVVTSLIDLNSQLDASIKTFDSMSRSQGELSKSARDQRGGLDDIAKSVSQYGKNLDDISPKTADAREKARSLADALQGDADKILTNGEALLQHGHSLDEVKGKMIEQAGAFEMIAIKAGIPREQVEQLLSDEGLLKPQIEQNFKASGLDQVTTQLQIMNLTLLKLADPAFANIDLSAILNAKTAEDQVKALNDAIVSLPPEKQAEIRAILDPTSVATANAGLDDTANPGGDPRTADVDAQAHTEEAYQTLLDVALAKYKAVIDAHGDPTQAIKDIQAIEDAHWRATVAVGADTSQFKAQISSAIASASASFQAANAAAGGHLFSYTGGIGVPGQIIPAPTIGYAAGGVDNNTLEAVRRKLAEGLHPAPAPGLYPPGSNKVFAEGRTGGEYFMTRDPAFRTANKQVLATAADDFGFNLVPKGQAAQIVNVKVEGGGQDPALLSETRKQTDLLDRALRRPVDGGGNVNVDGDLVLVDGEMGGPDLTKALRYVGG